MKKSDKEINRLLDEVTQDAGGVHSPDPPFLEYRKHLAREVDFDRLKGFDPRQLIRAARTHEELVFLGEWLQKEYGGDHPWWTDYHTRRISLAALPSYYGNDPVSGKGRFAAPLQAVVGVKKGGNPKNLSHRSVQRNLAPGILSYDQLIGQRDAFKVIEDANGMRISNARPLTSAKLPSNIPKDVVIFDLETTGFLKKGSNIVSLGMRENNVSKGLYANFPEGKKFSPFIENVIKPKWKKSVSDLLKSGGSVLSEKALLEKFIFNLESKGSNVALMGYNLKAFDIPMLQEVAGKYGLTGRLDSVLGKATVIDVAEHAKDFLGNLLGEQYPGWAQSELGLKPLGWQLSPVAEGFGMKTAGMAHGAEADVEMTEFIWNKLQAHGRGEKVEFLTDDYLNAVKASTGKEVLKLKPGMNRLNFAGEILPEASYQMSFMDHLGQMYPKTAAKAVGQADHIVTAGIMAKVAGAKDKLNAIIGKKVPGLTLGSALSTTAAFTSMNMIMPGNFWQNAASSVAFEAARVASKSRGIGGWKGFGIGAAAGAITSMAFSAIRPNPDKVSDTDLINGLVGNRFSAHNSNYNTIEGLRDEGFRQSVRKELTEFGSGYQGPNPWLNPEYNSEEEVELYKTMRASKLGLSEEEMYKYMTRKESAMSEYVYATASAGSAQHLIEEAKAMSSGKAISAEGFLYDPVAQITGHTDITDVEGRPLDYKTVSKKKLEEIRQNGPVTKNVHQLNWYMHMQGADSGILEYINRADTSDRSSYEVQYDPTMVQEDIAKIQRVRQRVQQEIESGLIDESKLPKGPSIETLQAAAKEDEGTAINNAGNIDYLEGVYKQEMDYLNSVKPSYGSSRPKTRKVILYTGTAQDLIDSFRFSGQDDAYNTIEGLRHDGIAQDTRHALTEFGSGWSRKAFNAAIGFFTRKPKVVKGFSVAQIKKFGKMAETSSVKDFAQHMGVELVDPSNMPARHKMLETGGGAYVWSKELNLSEHQIQLVDDAGKVGMKQNTPYIDPEIVNWNINSIIGKSESEIQKIPQSQKDSLVKLAIFHEAAEKQNALALHGKGMLSSDRMLKDPHRMSMVQEDLFLRSQKDNDTLALVRRFREQTDPFIKIPGKDDAYNTIEGLRHGGMSEDIRKVLTEFGSGWDALRAVATKMYKGVDKEEAFKLLRQSDEFQAALSKATSKGVLGFGASGTTHLMSTAFRGEEFQFARKMGNIWEHEAAAMRSVESTISPSVYRSTENVIDMELFKGNILADHLKNLPEAELTKLASQTEDAFSQLHKAGYRHGDPNLGNIFLVEHEGERRIGLIDFGASKKLEGVSKGQAQEFIAEDINVGVGAIEEEIRRRQGKGPGSTFKPAFFTEGPKKLAEPEEEIDFMAFLTTSPAEVAQKEKRLTNFRRISTDAGGVGLRSAHNGGRGHCRTASRRSSN